VDTMICEKTQSYLGMIVEVQDHAGVENTIYYIEQLLLEIDIPLVLYKHLQ
jgi:hypothetical protein